MGETRDRVLSGLKAAATNRSKDIDYYSKIAPLGGQAVEAGKRAFSTVVGLASQASRKRHGIKDEHVVQYVVKAAGIKAYTATTRNGAREYKRLLAKDKKIKANIIRIEYAGDPYAGAFIFSEGEVW